MASIYLGTDHAGFELKESIEKRLVEAGHEVVDCGADAYEKDDDYPDFIEPTARRVQENTGSFGIIFGHSGQGEAMAANRFKGIRAAVYYGGPDELLTLSREHNDANVLSLGAAFIGKEDAWRAVERWLETPFSGDERHVRRIQKLDD
ncbi:MAG: RpiB/LacA/LacB family sugar-phosphate isomerase [Candidatus Paceibacteria bacterium]